MTTVIRYDLPCNAVFMIRADWLGLAEEEIAKIKAGSEERRFSVQTEVKYIANSFLSVAPEGNC